MGCLYQLSFPNGKTYIGITRSTAERRLKGHVKGSKNPRHLVTKAIAKYGVPKVETLIICDDWESLCSMEQRAIKVYAPAYNMTAGGEGVLDPHGEVRTKISAKSTEQWKSSAARQANAAANVATWADPQKRKSLGELRVAQWKTPEYRTKVTASIRRGKATQAIFHYGAISTRIAYGECILERRECSLIA